MNIWRDMFLISNLYTITWIVWVKHALQSGFFSEMTNRNWKFNVSACKIFREISKNLWRDWPQYMVQVMRSIGTPRLMWVGTYSAFLYIQYVPDFMIGHHCIDCILTNESAQANRRHVQFLFSQPITFRLCLTSAVTWFWTPPYTTKVFDR